MLAHQLLRLMETVQAGDFEPHIYYKNADSTADTVFPQPGQNLEPAEFSAVPLTMYGDLTDQAFDSISALLESYYASKNTLTRIRQKSSDLGRTDSHLRLWRTGRRKVHAGSKLLHQ